MSVVVLPEQLCPAEIMSKPGRLEGDQASVRLFRSIAIPRCSRLLLVLYLLALIGRFSLCASAAETSALPAISGFSPVSGSPGTLVILSGSNLLQVTSISFNGVLAPVYGGTDDGTAVQTAVPTNAVTGPISIETAKGTATSQASFTVIDLGAPVVSSFSPTNGPVGTAVTITGSNLAGVTRVQFNGTDALFSTIQGLVAYVPTNAVSGPIKVTTGQGTFSTTQIFTVTKLGPPVIASFAPTNGPVGTFVEFKGSNLVQVQSVSFNGTAAQFADYGSSAEPHPGAIVPAGATTGPIAIVTPAGSFTTAQPFSVTTTPGPVITSFTPAAGKVGDLVTIYGKNFVGVQSVFIAGVKTEALPFLPTEMDVRIPYGPSGPIKIVTENGSFSTTTSFIIVNGAPPLGLSNMLPSSAPPGALIELTLTNLFGTVESVRFNGVDAQFAAYGSQVVAEVPRLATTGPVTVETTTGNAVSTKSFIIYNSGEMVADVSCSRDPVLKGTSALFSIVITNLADTAVAGLAVTNSFAGGEPTNDQYVVWTNGQPAFVNVAAAQLKIISVHSSQGASIMTNGMAITDLGVLAAGKSALIEVEIEPQSADILHHLVSATGTVVGLGQVYTSDLNTVNVADAVLLSVRQHNTGEVEITWPVVEPPLLLESTDNPSGASGWKPVNATVTVVTGHNSVIIPVGAFFEFYRLVPAAQ